MNIIRVLVVDDSAQMRRLLTAILESDPEIEVCGTACDPYDARNKIKLLNPDVLTLDVVMPKMDGVTFLRNIMRLHPMPVIMISATTSNTDEERKHTLMLGAQGFIKKPANIPEEGVDDFTKQLHAMVKKSVAKKPDSFSSEVTSPDRYKNCLCADAVIKKHTKNKFREDADSIIVIGASTGGTEAIKEIMEALPADAPAVVITQHISLPFSTNFAKRMNSISALTVCEAMDGQQIIAGHAYISPGNKHLLIEQDGNGYICKLSDDPPVNHHKPSVDVLFRSTAQSAGQKAICVLLTGMGKDGAQGMKELHEAGAHTIAQDKKSSVVWGMPGAAVKLGVADFVLSIDKIASKIKALIYTAKHAAKTSCRKASS